MRRAWTAGLPACVVALVAAAVAAIVAAVPATTAAPAPAKGSAHRQAPRVSITPGVMRLAVPKQTGPPTTAQCERAYGIACYQPGQLRAAYNLPPLYGKGITGKGQTIVIVDSFGSPTIRQDLAAFDKQFGYPRAALVHDHRAGREDPGVQPQRPRHGRLGERDHAGRGVRARPGAGGEHPAGRDPGRGDGGNHRLPADRRRGEVRDRSPSRRRDQPELQRHRGDVRQPRAAQPAARRLSRRVRPPRHGARRLRRQRRHRLRARPAHVLHAPGDVVAGQRPAGDRGRRHPADPGRRQVHVGGLERHRRHRGGQVLRPAVRAGPVRQRRRHVRVLRSARPTRTASRP